MHSSAKQIELKKIKTSYRVVLDERDMRSILDAEGKYPAIIERDLFTQLSGTTNITDVDYGNHGSSVILLNIYEGCDTKETRHLIEQLILAYIGLCERKLNQNA